MYGSSSFRRFRNFLADAFAAGPYCQGSRSLWLECSRSIGWNVRFGLAERAERAGRGGVAGPRLALHGLLAGRELHGEVVGWGASGPGQRHHDRMSSPYETGRSANVGELDQVASHADVTRVVEEMLSDLRQHPDQWENLTLERFLDALSASLSALPSLYANEGKELPEQPSWRILAEVLVMASGYE